MQIQSFASSPTAKLDERPVAASGQAAIAGRRPAPDTADSIPGVAAGKEEVSAAVKTLNEAMPQAAHSLEFEIDEDSQQVVVKIIDRSTREVVRQIPTEEALEMAKSFDKMKGLMIRETA